MPRTICFSRLAVHLWLLACARSAGADAAIGPRPRHKSAPRTTIALLTADDRPWVLEKLRCNRETYARRWGYASFLVLVGTELALVDKAMRKPFLIAELFGAPLQSPPTIVLAGEPYDWVVWYDSDVVIISPWRSLLSVIRAAEADSSGPVDYLFPRERTNRCVFSNFGFIVRNSRRTLRFARDWARFGAEPKACWMDQGAMWRTILFHATNRSNPFGSCTHCACWGSRVEASISGSGTDCAGAGPVYWPQGRAHFQPLKYGEDLGFAYQCSFRPDREVRPLAAELKGEGAHALAMHMTQTRRNRWMAAVEADWRRAKPRTAQLRTNGSRVLSAFEPRAGGAGAPLAPSAEAACMFGEARAAWRWVFSVCMAPRQFFLLRDQPASANSSASTGYSLHASSKASQRAASGALRRGASNAGLDISI